MTAPKTTTFPFDDTPLAAITTGQLGKVTLNAFEEGYRRGIADRQRYAQAGVDAYHRHLVERGLLRTSRAAKVTTIERDENGLIVALVERER